MGKEMNKELETIIRLNLINLRYRAGKTQGEIASITGKSVNAVGSFTRAVYYHVTEQQQKKDDDLLKEIRIL